MTDERVRSRSGRDHRHRERRAAQSDRRWLPAVWASPLDDLVIESKESLILAGLEVLEAVVSHSTSILRGAKAMTDERIRRAKRAELQALVDRHGTENERWALTMSGMMRAGVTLTQLRTAALNDESLGPLPPDPDFLARIARRVDRRRRLGLPRKDCTAPSSRRVVPVSRRDARRDRRVRGQA